MAAPIQMFTHALDYLKGWFSPYAVDIAGKLHADVTTDPLYAGRVVRIYSMSSDGKTPYFKPGASDEAVPIFLMNGTDQLDVQNYGGTGASTYWTAIAPAGWLSGLVGIDSFELETTEFDTALTYLPNEPLSAVTSDSASNAGTLTNASITFYDDPVCGVVSRGKRTNAHGVSVLAFWTYFLPKNV